MSNRLVLVLAAPYGAAFTIAYFIKHRHASVASNLVLVGFLIVQWAAIIVFKRQHGHPAPDGQHGGGGGDREGA